MRQLTSLDAQFLALENARQAGHVGSLAILDPATAPTGRLGYAEISALLRERLPLLSPLRWRLTEVPFGLDYPFWVDDGEFDLDYHVRELALAAPGNDDQLAEQTARIMSRPLDRARPLWELYVIEGLESGYIAVLTKIHHAVVDGLSGAEIMGLLLDLAPEGRELPEPQAPSARGSRVVTARPRRRASRLRRRRSTRRSRRTGASTSAGSRSPTSRRSRTRTARPSTTSSSRSAPAPCATG